MSSGTQVKTLFWQCAVALTFLLFVVTSAQSAEQLRDFDSDEQAALFVKLTKDHRCVKCQNQNLADSNASIAGDMRDEIYDKVRAGESGDDISAYLVARYGDFVRYKPAFKPTTLALWIGPFVLLFLAVGFAVRLSRQSGKHANQKSGQRAAPDDAALVRAKELLKK